MSTSTVAVSAGSVIEGISDAAVRTEQTAMNRPRRFNAMAKPTPRTAPSSVIVANPATGIASPSISRHRGDLRVRSG